MWLHAANHVLVIVMLTAAAHAFDVMALVREGDDEATLYRRAAAAEVLGWHDRLVRRLRALGAHVLDVEPRQLTADLVNRYLEIKVRHLL